SSKISRLGITKTQTPCLTPRLIIWGPIIICPIIEEFFGWRSTLALRGPAGPLTTRFWGMVAFGWPPCLLPNQRPPSVYSILDNAQTRGFQREITTQQA